VAWLINWADQHRIDTCSATDHPTIAGPSVWTSGTLEVNAGQRILDANSKQLFAEGGSRHPNPGGISE